MPVGDMRGKNGRKIGETAGHFNLHTFFTLCRKKTLRLKHVKSEKRIRRSVKLRSGGGAKLRISFEGISEFRSAPSLVVISLSLLTKLNRESDSFVVLGGR